MRREFQPGAAGTAVDHKASQSPVPYGPAAWGEVIWLCFRISQGLCHATLVIAII